MTILAFKISHSLSPSLFFEATARPAARAYRIAVFDTKSVFAVIMRTFAAGVYPTSISIATVKIVQIIRIFRVAPVICKKYAFYFFTVPTGLTQSHADLLPFL